MYICEILSQQKLYGKASLPDPYRSHICISVTFKAGKRADLEGSFVTLFWEWIGKKDLI